MLKERSLKIISKIFFEKIFTNELKIEFLKVLKVFLFHITQYVLFFLINKELKTILLY